MHKKRDFLLSTSYTPVKIISNLKNMHHISVFIFYAYLMVKNKKIIDSLFFYLIKEVRK